MPTVNNPTIEVKTGTSVFHVTDLEGRWELLQRSIDNYNSGKEDALQIKIEIDADGKERLAIPDNVIFVHGGDASDKGISDLRIRRLFINTKEHYAKEDKPNKIVLIGGNRDYINLRYHQELHVPRIYETLLENKRPEWAAGALKFAAFVLQKSMEDLGLFNCSNEQVSRILNDADISGLAGVITYARSNFDKNKNQQTATKSAPTELILKELKAYLESKYKKNDDGLQLLYLQWMNTQTMGRQDTIGSRKLELRLEKFLKLNRTQYKNIQDLLTKDSKEIRSDDPRLLNIDVSDNDVLASFKETAEMRKYLELTQVAVKIGNETIGYKMFAHSGMNPDALTLNGKKHEDIDAFMAAVNEQAQKDIADIYGKDYSRSENPDKNLPYAEILRLSLPDGKTGQKDDNRTGTIISFECWKKLEKEVELDNGVKLAAGTMVPNLSPEIVAKMRDAKIVGIATGHKPTGDSELGTIYVLEDSAGKLFTIATPDITFAQDSKRRCYAVYDFTDEGIEGRLVAHSAKLNDMITSKMPLTGLKVKALAAKAIIYPGKILYCPDFSTQLDYTKPGSGVSEYDASKATSSGLAYLAWNVILVDHPEEPSKIILQRMDNNKAIQIVIDATNDSDPDQANKQQAINNLVSYHAVKLKEAAPKAAAGMFASTGTARTGIPPKVGGFEYAEFKKAFEGYITTQTTSTLKSTGAGANIEINKAVVGGATTQVATISQATDSVGLQLTDVKTAIADVKVIANAYVTGLMAGFQAFPAKPFTLRFNANGDPQQTKELCTALLQAFVDKTHTGKITLECTDATLRGELQKLQDTLFQPTRGLPAAPISSATLKRGLAAGGGEEEEEVMVSAGPRHKITGTS